MRFLVFLKMNFKYALNDSKGILNVKIEENKLNYINTDNL